MRNSIKSIRVTLKLQTMLVVGVGTADLADPALAQVESSRTFTGDILVFAGLCTQPARTTAPTLWREARERGGGLRSAGSQKTQSSVK